MKGVNIDEAYQNLANAIVKNAADDYRAALRGLERNPESKGYQSDAERIEKFFRSPWYEMLTDVDGEYLIRRLQEDEKERSLKRQRKKGEFE